SSRLWLPFNAGVGGGTQRRRYHPATDTTGCRLGVYKQMATFSFQQVDVFASRPLKGNPLAVVIDADAISKRTMAALASWTNRSETTFLLRRTNPLADDPVRIFPPERELPFAGHPTLGSCQVGLSSGGKPKHAQIVQECSAGLIKIRRDDERLAFAAPPL